MDLKNYDVAIPFFARFRTRLDLLILLVFLPALGLTIYTNFTQRQTEKARIREGTIALAKLAAANQESYVRNAQQLLATLAQFSFLVQTTNRLSTQTHLNNLRQLAPDYLDFGLIEADGKMFVSTVVSNAEPNLADKDFFQRTVRTKRFSIGGFEPQGFIPGGTLDFGHPILDDKRRISRVLYASLNLSLLGTVVTSISLPTGASLTVFDRKGVVVARHPEQEKWLGKTLSTYPTFHQIQKEKTTSFEGPGLDGVKRLFAVATINNGNEPALYISIGIPTKISFASANRSLLRGILALSAIALLALVAAHFYAEYHLLRPMAQLVKAANQLSAGDYTVRTALPANCGEISLLGQHLDNMAASLQSRQIQLQAATDEVTRVNTDLEQRVKQRTAQLEDLNRELEAFSYSVSHDLQAPLRHINGFVDLIREDSDSKLSEGSTRSFRIITEATDQMRRLIEDLLSFSRTGRATMELSPVSNSSLVREAREEVSRDISGRDIRWDVGFLPDVTADRAMLRQVWINLLSNAVKYTGQREQAVIAVGCQETTDEFEFFVRDNGAGFDMRYVQKLFGVFQRLHRADQFQGTGIGLANVRRIVRRHEGRTWAEGTPNAGATFYFSLPRQPLT